MAEQDPRAPVVRFAMEVIEAADVDTLARVCADAMVAWFGALRASVVDGEKVWHHAGELPRDGEVSWVLSLRVSAPEEPNVRLDLALPDEEDRSILRQQFLDLVTMVRRAWARLRQLERERENSHQDTLTGLGNRRGFDETMDTVYLDAVGRAAPLAVMVVDLDHFKLVNDTQGHPAGDDVLQCAASCFRTHLRPDDRVYRWGGDEFLIVLPNASARAAATVADRLREAFAGQPRARGTTMTIGIADLECLPPGGDPTSQGLIDAADQSLLEAKRLGRNRTALAQRWPGTG